MALFDEIIQEVRERLDDFKEIGHSLSGGVSKLVQKEYQQFRTTKYFSAFQHAAVGAADTDIEIPFDIVPQSSLWEVRRYSVTGSNNGQVAIYLNEIAPHTLLSYIDQSGIGAGGFENYLIVPGGSKLIAHFYNQQNNQECTIRLDIRQFQENVGWNERELDD